MTTMTASNMIELVQGTFGCPCGMHVEAMWPDQPYTPGCSYSGIIEHVNRQADEDDAAFMARADRRARQLSRCDR